MSGLCLPQQPMPMRMIGIRGGAVAAGEQSAPGYNGKVSGGRSLLSNPFAGRMGGAANEEGG